MSKQPRSSSTASAIPKSSTPRLGEIYRWSLERPHGLHLHVTFDSPELPDLAHVIVSDPLAKDVEPVASLTMRTMEEVHAIIDRILEQWKAYSPEVGRFGRA